MLVIFRQGLPVQWTFLGEHDFSFCLFTQFFVMGIRLALRTSFGFKAFFFGVGSLNDFSFRL